MAPSVRGKQHRTPSSCPICIFWLSKNLHRNAAPKRLHSNNKTSFSEICQFSNPYRQWKYNKCKCEIKSSVVLWSILCFVQHVGSSHKSCASRPDGTVTGSGTRQNELRVRQLFDSKGINRGPGVKKRGTDAGMKKKSWHWMIDFCHPFYHLSFSVCHFNSTCNPVT